MKKLFVMAMAAVFSVAMVSSGFAQSTTTEKKMEKAEDKAEKKAEKAADKAEKKAEKAEKKAAKKKDKMEKKEAANPCAAKSAEKK